MLTNIRKHFQENIKIEAHISQDPRQIASISKI